MFIGVSGLIGAGKSTLTQQLADELERREMLKAQDIQAAIAAGFPRKWKPVFEPVDNNPYLEDFYLDISRWTFNMQMFLLAKRFQQHQEVLWDPCHRDGGGIVQDRTIYEDTIFARMHHEDGLMVGRDWDTYISHFHIMQGFLRYPDLILYLKVSPETALERIEERGRDEERGKVSLTYLKSLYDGYEQFVAEMKRFTVVVEIDWETYKPVSEVADLVLASARKESKFLRSLVRI